MPPLLVTESGMSDLHARGCQLHAQGKPADAQNIAVVLKPISRG